MEYNTIIVDDPAPMVRRVTLNRPAKRNAINRAMRSEILHALLLADRDDDVRVTILRGAGSCFSSGYELGRGDVEAAEGVPLVDRSYYSIQNGFFALWDLAKPVIAQVHSYCLAGGAELATACDLVYVAEDAQIGYPPVRSMSPPDIQFHPWLVGMRNALEAMLTGDSTSGVEAARMGFANRAFPADELEERVLEMAGRVAKIPTDLQQINKRSVYTAMEIMGVRSAIRAGEALHVLGHLQPSSVEYKKEFAKGVKHAVRLRDAAFGDYTGAKEAPPQEGES